MLVRGLDPRRGGVADAVWLGRGDRARRHALVADELGVVVEPAPIAVRVELAQEQHAGVVAMEPPRAQERLERPLLGDREVRPIGVGGLDQDVEVADGAEPRRDLPQAAAMLLRPLRPERLAEDPPGRALAARRNPHPVEILGVDAVACPGLLGDHPREVEAEDLAPRLRDVIVDEDTRASCRPRDAAARPLPARRGWSPRGAASSIDPSAGRQRRGRVRRPLAGSAGSDATGRAGSTVGAASVAGAGRSASTSAPPTGSSASVVVASSSASTASTIAWIGGLAGGVGSASPSSSSIGRSAAAPRLFALRLRGRGRPERRLELGRVGRCQAGIRGEGAIDLGQPGLVAVDQLDLELDEPPDHAAPADGIDLVEAELDRGAVQLEDPLAAELADRDDLDERRVAALLEDQRAGIGRRPVARMGGPIGRALQLLAAVDVARADPPDRRLDRDGRRLGGLTEPGGEPGSGHRAIGRIDVAVLDLGRADGGGRPEPGDLVGGEVAIARRRVRHAVLQLDLERLAAVLDRGS